MYVPVSDHNLNICCNSTINIGLHVLITGFQAPTACILGESTFIFPHLNDDQLLVPLFSHHSFHKSTNPGFSLLRRADILSKVKLPRRHRGSLQNSNFSSSCEKKLMRIQGLLELLAVIRSVGRQSGIRRLSWAMMSAGGRMRGEQQQKPQTVSVTSRHALGHTQW